MSYSDKVASLIQQWDEENDTSRRIFKQDLKLKKKELLFASNQIENMKLYNVSLLRENKNLWKLIKPGKTPIRATLRNIRVVAVKMENVEETEEVVVADVTPVEEAETAVVEAEEVTTVVEAETAVEEVTVVQEVTAVVEAEEITAVEEAEEITAVEEAEEITAVEEAEEVTAVEEAEEAEEVTAVEEAEEVKSVGEDVEVKVEEEEEEEEEEVFLVKIEGTNFYTSNEKNGLIYEVTPIGEVGKEVGYYEDGEPGFYED